MATLVDIKVPDIGDFKDVEVVEVMVKPGDKIGVDDALVAIESDKATMEVPAPQAGVVKELKVKVGDKVSEGSPIIVLEAEAAAPDGDAKPPVPAGQAKEPALDSEAKPPAPDGEAKPSGPPALTLLTAPAKPPASPDTASPPSRLSAAPAPGAVSPSPISAAPESTVKRHASPSVRKFARQLGVDLSHVKGSGLKGRIFRDDVQRFVKDALTNPAAMARRSGAPFDLNGSMWSFGKGPGLAFPPKTDGDFGSNKTMFWLNLYDHRIAQLVEFSVQHQSFCSQSTRLKVTIRGTAKGADPCVWRITDFPRISNSPHTGHQRSGSAHLRPRSDSD